MRSLQLFLLCGLLGCTADYQVTEQSAQVVVSPALADAGVVGLGETATVDVSVVHANGGTVRVLAVDVLALDGDAFTAPDAPFPEVVKDATETLTFTFAPDEEGYFRSRVTVSTDEARDNEHVVVLRGQAAQASVEVLPSIVDFGPVTEGDEGEASVILVNLGATVVSLDSLAFDGDRFASVLDLPAEVEPGESLAVPLTYRADDAVETEGALALTVSPTAAVAPVTLRANACSTGGGPLYDADGDGFSACGVDCDDGDADVSPAGVETCDGTDEDCDGTIDEGTSCSDDDGDGATEDDGDCNDGDAAVGPGETEAIDNGVDDDCDGVVDGGSTDGDGDGYDTTGGDCDDADATAYPGAPETADDVDDDCDGTIDEGTTAGDDDGDGVSEDAGDCDDTAAETLPGAAEIADGMDNDCDGTVDEGTEYADDDGDGVNESGGDCDDADPDAYPGAVEIAGDGIDNDCDGTVE